MYMFIALRPLIRRFKYCRPIVVIDGAHLSGAYKGAFVSTSTLNESDMYFCCSNVFVNGMYRIR